MTLHNSIAVYDLTGTQRCYLYTLQGDGTYYACKFKPLNPLLIYPREESSNRTPYLQNFHRPFITDLWDSVSGKAELSRSVFLEEMMNDILKMAPKLSLWFTLQKQALGEAYSNADFNVLLVPDTLGASAQEQLLLCCGMNRNRTRLLWRSVAITLGAEKDWLKNSLAKAGMPVRVYDCQQDGSFGISILEMKLDSQMLVPLRYSCNFHPEKYPRNNQTSPLPPVQPKLDPYNKQDQENYRFWRHTCISGNQSAIVYTSNGWRKLQFPERRYNFVPPHDENSAPSAISIYSGCMNFPLQHSGIIYRDPCSTGGSSATPFAVTGALRFALRSAANLPTYFDECEPLYFIFQDVSEERIRERELLSGGQFRGGEEREGAVNRDFFIEKDNSGAMFLMHHGELKRDTHLRGLRTDFKTHAPRKIPLTLYPTMIPGQGIARVRAEAPGFLKEPVYLDFLEMELAYSWRDEKDNFHIDIASKCPSMRGANNAVTIISLEEEIPRSFPVDFPYVDAAIPLAISDAERFAKPGKIPPDLFYRKRFLTLSSTDYMERLKAVNVFGSNPAKSEPDVGRALLNTIYSRIRNEYSLAKKIHGPNAQECRNWLRMAAWTYQVNNPYFKEIVADVMDSIQRRSRGEPISPCQQAFTACSNILSPKQRIEYIQCFIEHAKRQVLSSIPQIPHMSDDLPKPKWETAANGRMVTLVDWWIRALRSILCSDNQIMKKDNFTSEQCFVLARCICWILLSYTVHKKNENYISPVFNTLLFLLRRRIFENSFLRQNSPLYSYEHNYLLMLCKHNSRLRSAQAFQKFLSGCGRLSDIPIDDDEE